MLDRDSVIENDISPIYDKDFIQCLQRVREITEDEDLVICVDRVLSIVESHKDLE